MKSAIGKIPLALFVATILLLSSFSQVQAHCHQLTDKTGDSGSSFGFTDIVATELSNQGSSIGVKITTAGSIPNGFGTTGQMIFGVIFPARLLSQDQNDTGINFITIHWKEDGTGWEGSQFVYREKLESKPWNASIQIDGKTATFSIPKELIGKGDLAYLVSIGLVSEDTNSNDYAPDNSFSDCFIIPQNPSPQTAVNQQEKSPSPQIIAEAPKKEGNKFIERSGVNRLTNKDPGQSLVLPGKMAASPATQLIQSPQSQTQPAEKTKTAEPPSVLVGLIAIAFLGIAAVGASNYLLKNQNGEKQPDDCEKIRQYIKDKKERIEEYKKRLDDAKERAKAGQKGGEYDAKRVSDELAREERILTRLEEKLAECEKKVSEKEGAGKDQKFEPKVVPKDGKVKTISEKAWEEYDRDAEDTYLEIEYEKPTGKCRVGDRKYAEKFDCSFTILDKDGEIEILTAADLGKTGKVAENFGKTVKRAGQLTGFAGKGAIKIPLKAVGKLIEAAGEISIAVSKIPKRLLIIGVTIPTIKVTYSCRKLYVCLNGKWVEQVQREDTEPKREKVKEPIGGWEDPGVMTHDQLKKFLNEEIKRRCRDESTIGPNPCIQCRLPENLTYGE